ncbi:hypothetical protein KCMC57_up00850 [Kitasatospora sp. CMC57]|uniref:Transposase n=1 Tax=Kitasatospora sp. CMC57 TaxID=3231513 RepID=A0AB33JLK2_9ACTN
MPDVATIADQLYRLPRREHDLPLVPVLPIKVALWCADVLGACGANE